MFSTLFQNIEVYSLPIKSKSDRVKKNKEDTTRSDSVIEGVTYNRTNEEGYHLSYQKAGRVSNVVDGLDGWDTAHLDDVLGKGKWSETIALSVKSHRANGLSAQSIEKQHRGANGSLERGYSERNVAKYIKAFIAAEDDRNAES